MTSAPFSSPSGFVPASEDAPLVHRLYAFPFTAGLTPAGLATLEQACRPLHFSQTQPLLTAGQSCSALLLLERGSIRVSKSTESGREILLYRVDPGESCVLGTTCLLRNTDYPAEAEAQAGSSALAVNAETFRYLHDHEPAIRRFVMDLYAQRLEEMMLLVEAVAFRRMDERLAELLLRTGRIDAFTCRPITMTHEAIAAELGTAREVVSRLLSQFADEGSIALERRNIRILNPARLETSVQS